MLIEDHSDHSCWKRLQQIWNLTPTIKESVIHYLFGGKKNYAYVNIVSTRQALFVKSWWPYVCNFDALDQDITCDNVLTQIADGPWKKVNEIGLTSDVFTKTSGTVEILLGSDIMGKVLTGSVKQIPCGLVAVETECDWTMLRKWKGRLAGH